MIPAWRQRLSIFKHPLFLAGLALKIPFLFIGGSSYFNEFFIPFLDRAVLNPSANPWTLSPPEYFPYGSFLFLVLGIPKLIFHAGFGEAALGLTVISFFSLKAPLLVFDTLLLWTLSRIAHDQPTRVLTFYWLNPILFYISYVYGQLDVISMSLCVTSLFLVTKSHFKAAGFALACAVLSKFHVALILPLVAAFIWHNHFLRQAALHLAKFFIVFIAISTLGFLPVFWASHFGYATTLSPEALRIFSTKMVFNEQVTLYIGVMILAVAMSRLIFSSRITALGLVYGAGLLFGLLVLVTNPMPGWYYWFLPFVALFLSQYRSVPKVLFLAFTFAYFLDFLILPEFTSNALLLNLAFTLMQAGLLLMLIVMSGPVRSFEAPLLFRMKPLMIGISGDSGSGKDHFTKILISLLGKNQTAVVQGDDYHRWERGHEKWAQLTHLSPLANHLVQMQRHATQISLGRTIMHHHYDHDTGRFTFPRALTPSKNVILQGLHSLYSRTLREQLDISIFLSPDESVRRYWKLRRDVGERGHSPEKVMESLRKREGDSALHIQPQREKSDWIIEYLPGRPSNAADWSSAENLPLKVRHILYSDENVLELAEALAREQISVETAFSNQEDRIELTLAGEIDAERIARIAEGIYPSLRPILRGRHAPVFDGGYDGMNQLIFVALLQKRLERLP